MIRAVLDTNVIVSALITKKPSPPLEIYQALISQNFLHISSIPIIEEIEEVIKRENMIKLHHLSSTKQTSIIEKLANISLIVSGKINIHLINEDPQDNKFLEAAVEGNAALIVSGDKHLLKLKEYKGIKIVKPVDFIPYFKS